MSNCIVPKSSSAKSRDSVPREIIVIGTSWGGLEALREVLGCLPADFALPVVVVQHRHRESVSLLPSLLQDRTALAVCDIEDKAPILGGHIHLAPPDYHVLIGPGYFSLSLDEAVRFSRPSIDVTFASAADVYGAGAVGVILTGANADGALGLRRVADRGGLSLVQLPGTAESPKMPMAALAAVPDARTLTLQEICTTLGALSRPAGRP